MASKKTTDPEGSSGTLPFGAGAIDPPSRAPRAPREEETQTRGATRGRQPRSGGADAGPGPEPARPRGEPAAVEQEERRPKEERRPGGGDGGDGGEGGTRSRRRRWQERRRRRRRQRGDGEGREGQERGEDGRPVRPVRPERPERPPRRERPERRERAERPEGGDARRQGGKAPAELGEGMLMIEHANHGHLRQLAKQWLGTKDDPHVAPHLVQRYALREGSIVSGPLRRGQGRHRWELVDVQTVDGRQPNEAKSLPSFKNLVSIDPDFHYAVGDATGEVSLKVLDIICPVGRGQRGLIVAPPRSGKTILLQQFAKAIEKVYPEVHLMVLLIDERPEEATEWRRTIDKGEVFVSTNDELHKRHVELAEAVWKRCRRLVELGEDVILLLDSITRLGRAYNNVHGTSGKTMSGGIDTRALERPKQFFGSARNTESAGSLTILGTTLIETGSRMDQVIFEEFKGTGNMELVLARRLADRRIFPAIDLERSGTRKEAKLLSSRRLHLINTLRRVLSRMHWAEAMELLITKLDEVERTDDFLLRFEVDPEA